MITPETWRKVDLELERDGKVELEVTLLRPTSWLELHGVELGKTVDLNLPELGARGAARVLAIGPCPAIESGDGRTTRVVTATFKHHRGYPWRLKVEGVGEAIGVTRAHLVWSVDRTRWVAVGHLREGERVKLADSETRVESVAEVSKDEAGGDTGATPVYNLEVDADHVYRVTEAIRW